MEPQVKFVDEEHIRVYWTQASSQPANIKNQAQSYLQYTDSLPVMVIKNDWKFKREQSGKMHV